MSGSPASVDTNEVASALARTRQSYDDTPYDSKPLIRSHPGRMAAQAIWRGLSVPDVAEARMLEIGCASGGHLMPLAAALPGARFLGVDLSPVQIAAGEARRRRLGLDNIELRAASFEALGEADGVSDFIVCHGVYSWIPEPLRDSLMSTIQARLAPQGIAMVSYNVLPGWRLFQIARENSMLLNARLIDPAQRAEKSRELFALLAEGSETRHSYGKFWRDEAKELLGGGDAYLAHEIFEDSNAPLSFADFNDHAGRRGLDYLGETLVGASLPDERAPDGAEHIRRLSGGDRLKRETYIDIFSGRTFRKSLLIRAGRAGGLADGPDDHGLEALHFIPALDLKMATAPDEPGTFSIALRETELNLRNTTPDRRCAGCWRDDRLRRASPIWSPRNPSRRAPRSVISCGWRSTPASWRFPARR